MYIYIYDTKKKNSGQVFFPKPWMSLLISSPKTQHSPGSSPGESWPEKQIRIARQYPDW